MNEKVVELGHIKSNQNGGRGRRGCPCRFLRRGQQRRGARARAGGECRGDRQEVQEEYEDEEKTKEECCMNDQNI